MIAERLRNIEESVARQQRAGSVVSSTATVAGSSGGFDHDVRIPTYESVSGEAGDPVSVVTSAIKGLEAAISAPSPFSPHNGSNEDASSPPSREVNTMSEPDVPDAISRGFVTVEEAQQLFDLWVDRLQIIR